MELKIINKDNQVTETYTDNAYIVAKLLGLLFDKTITKSKFITKTSYNYNYTDKQIIKFNLDNGYKFEFIDVPTICASLDENAIYNLLNGGGK